MLDPAAKATLTLDISTLMIVATCVAALLGLFMLFAWVQDRIRAVLLKTREKLDALETAVRELEGRGAAE